MAKPAHVQLQDLNPSVPLAKARESPSGDQASPGDEYHPNFNSPIKSLGFEPSDMQGAGKSDRLLSRLEKAYDLRF